MVDVAARPVTSVTAAPTVPPASAAHEASIAPAAALMADHTRATMLLALLDGRPLAASELARLAAVSAPTTSAHLAKLLAGGLVSVVRQGRHKYYRLSGPQVATAIEALAQIGPPAQVRSLRQSRLAVALAEARTCYDHLAGRAGVELLDAMLREGTLEQAPGPAAPHSGDASAGVDVADTRYVVTKAGSAVFASYGIGIEPIRAARRRFAPACLDWTQRRPHLGGGLGAAITTRLFELSWIERGPRSRSVVITTAGRAGLASTFGWSDGVARGALG
jgi:DNA-binding transcriptional ArsR family regulator